MLFVCAQHCISVPLPHNYHPAIPKKYIYIYMANIEPSRCVPNSFFLALPLRLYEHVGGSGGVWRWSGGCCLRALRERLDAVHAVRRRSETDDDSYQIGIHSTSLLLCTQHTFNSKERTETDIVLIVLIVLVTRRRSKYYFGATTTRYAMPCPAIQCRIRKKLYRTETHNTHGHDERVQCRI